MPDAGLSVSVVSHGHGAAVIALLGQMASVLESGGVGPCRVLLTVNCPEPGLVASVRARSWPFEVVVLENSSPAGFGANHNRAFERDRKLGASTVFGVVNPDVRLLDNQLAEIVTPSGARVPVSRRYLKELKDQLGLD